MYLIKTYILVTIINFEMLCSVHLNIICFFYIKAIHYLFYFSDYRRFRKKTMKLGQIFMRRWTTSLISKVYNNCFIVYKHIYLKKHFVSFIFLQD